MQIGDAVSELLTNAGALEALTSIEQPLPKTKLFLLCDNCYWCASVFKTRLIEIESCPQCQKQVSSIPLADNETYTYNYDISHGVVVDFWSPKKS